MADFKIVQKVLSIFVIAASVCLNVDAKPAKPGTFEYSQPDGTTIILSVKGDWRYKAYFNAEGKRVYKTTDGYFRPAENDIAVPDNEDSPITESQLTSKLSTPGRFNDSFPLTGDQRGLVVLVNSTDCRFSMENPSDFYSRMLNEEGFSDYGCSGSARDFFVHNSGGTFTPTFDVYGPVTLAHDIQYYGGNNAYGAEKHAYEMIVEACDLINDDVDLSQYDRDGDSLIDNVYVYYAGYGEADSYQENTVWPHSWFISRCTNDKHLYDGVLLDRYACSNEIDYSQKRPDGIGTFIHEFSHVMGLPDLYQTDSGTNCFTPGQWSVMDVGSYNNKGLTPPNYSSFERAALGWTVPEPIISTGICQLEDFGTSNAALMIPTARDNEWYLLENRQNTGYDEYLPGHGLVIWHIDYDGQIWLSNGVNNDPAHQRVDLIEADGKLNARTRGGDCFPGTSGVTSFTKDSSPALVSWNGRPIGFDILDIREDENGRITFNVADDSSGENYIKVNETCFRLEDNQLSCPAGLADVYDLSGRKIATVGNSPIELSPGLYIVKCGNKTNKLIVK